MLQEELKYKLINLENSRQSVFNTYGVIAENIDGTPYDADTIEHIKSKVEYFDKEIIKVKVELKQILLTDLAKEMLETGILDQKKIEETVAKSGIEQVEISEEAKEMKQFKSKVNNIFDKHLNKK